jgi:hypothetical protein
LSTDDTLISCASLASAVSHPSKGKYPDFDFYAVIGAGRLGVPEEQLRMEIIPTKRPNAKFQLHLGPI